MDIVDYYPSVSEDLYNEAIQFTEQFAPISTDDKHILKNALKSVLYHTNNVWEKQTGLFDTSGFAASARPNSRFATVAQHIYTVASRL